MRKVILLEVNIKAKKVSVCEGKVYLSQLLLKWDFLSSQSPSQSDEGNLTPTGPKLMELTLMKRQRTRRDGSSM